MKASQVYLSLGIKHKEEMTVIGFKREALREMPCARFQDDARISVK